MKEKREFVRLNLPVDVHFRQLESLKEHTHVYAKNVSDKGIRLSLGKKVLPNTFLELAMTVSDIPEPVWALGKVVWVKKVGKRYEAGVMLTHIRTTDTDRFQGYMEGVKSCMYRRKTD